MSSFPRVEICDSGVNFYCIWKGCLAVSQHLILLILLRIQHSKRPWTRAEFYCPSHPKKDIFSFGYCYGLEQNCFLQARVFECLSLGWDHCFWEIWSHSRRGLPGRAGHYVWAFENTAQAWFPSSPWLPGPEVTRSIITLSCCFRPGFSLCHIFLTRMDCISESWG